MVLVSSPIVTQIRASKLLVNQITNELNIGFVGTALSLMQGKIYLEQTVKDYLAKAKNVRNTMIVSSHLTQAVVWLVI